MAWVTVDYRHLGEGSFARKFNELIIHCTATRNGRDVTPKEIDVWHGEKRFFRNSKMIKCYNPKLKHVGYHGGFRIDGSMWTGRPLVETGAHCAPHNWRTIGWVLPGTDKYPLAVWEQLASHVRDWMEQGIKVSGHYVYNPDKTCPGFDVQQWILRGLEPLEGHVL